MPLCVYVCVCMRTHLLSNLCSGDQHWGGGPSIPCYFLLTCVLTRVRLCVTLWTVACQAPLFMGFSGKNTGVGCQALNRCPLHLLHKHVGSLPLELSGKP